MTVVILLTASQRDSPSATSARLPLPPSRAVSAVDARNGACDRVPSETGDAFVDARARCSSTDRRLRGFSALSQTAATNARASSRSAAERRRMKPLVSPPAPLEPPGDHDDHIRSCVVKPATGGGALQSACGPARPLAYQAMSCDRTSVCREVRCSNALCRDVEPPRLNHAGRPRVSPSPQNHTSVGHRPPTSSNFCDVSEARDDALTGATTENAARKEAVRSNLQACGKPRMTGPSRYSWKVEPTCSTSSLPASPCCESKRV